MKANVRSVSVLKAAADTVVYAPPYSPRRYTGADLAKLCNNDWKVAFALFRELEWEHPETLLDEDRRETPEKRRFVAETVQIGPSAGV